MRALLWLFLIYPFAEIFTLVLLAKSIGGLAVFLLVVASSLLGLLMLRNKELAALPAILSVLRQGERVSLYSLLWPLRYLLSGVLFLIPGILSSLAAVLLLLPFKGPNLASPGVRPAENGVFEGEYTRVDDPKPDSRKLH